jgi:HlyD family secretion protein
MLFVPDNAKAAVSPSGRLRSVGVTAWRWRYRAPLVLIAAAALWYYGAPRLLGPIVPAETIVRADFVQSVVASGSVLAPYRVNIGSQIVGIVADVPVAEGQAVKAGQTLVTLDDREMRASVVQAEGALAQAEARLRQLHELTLPSAEEALAQAQATLTNAQQAFERAQKLAAAGFGTLATLDDTTRAVTIAQAQVRSAEFQVHTNRPGGSDYVMAETQLNQARASLVAANSRLSYTTITAPRDGVLISRNVERGYVVQPSNVLMVLSPVGETQLTVQIDEKNFGLIALGEKALASADAFPNQTFPAEVVYINPGVDLQRASVQVKLRVPDPPAYLQQDMTVSVDIETARHPGALVAPMSAIHGQENGKPWVMKIDDARARRQDVTIGLNGAGKAEILSGLQAGDLVLPASSPIKPGTRVRTRAAPVRVP